MSLRCNTCSLELELKDFPKTGKGYTSKKCKSCTAIYKKQWKLKNSSRVRAQNAEWRRCNRDRALASCKAWYEINKHDPDLIKKRKKNSQTWYQNNKEKSIAYSKKYRKSNIESVREYAREYQNNRMKKDTNFKLSKSLRSRLSHAVTGNFKSGSAVKDLGCSIPDLKKHLEAQFQPGMSWDNYGEWEIDHILPLCSVDLSDEIQFKKVSHYSNLQPLWRHEHRIKSTGDIKKRRKSLSKL